MVAFLSKVSIAMLFLAADAVSLKKPKNDAPVVDAKASLPKLRGVNASSVEHALIGSQAGNMPCQCEASNPAWKKCTRTVPRCVFIDLGAADGNSFNDFLKGTYGPVDKCPSVQWHAVLVEANPRFDQDLGNVGKEHRGLIDVMSSTAAYICEAQTSFYLDTVNTGQNFWGSSMSENHPDVQKSGKQKVTVPTSNLNRILYEGTIPGDWVMVKMDIEGSEYDVLPCLSTSESASLIDRLYLEDHHFLPPQSRGSAGTSVEQFQASKEKLKARGVDIPDYFSNTL
jgi:FkbM family methyltransferase